MQVILLKETDGLGRMGDAVRVRDGYARNYLLPRKIAVLATKGNLDKARKLKEERQAVESKHLEEAKALAAKLDQATCVFHAKAGEEGKMFGAVTVADIEENLKEQGMEVERKKIHMDGAIKDLGEYQASIKVYPEVTATVKIRVLRE